MERHGKLFDAICDIKNIELAHANAKKGKRNYSEVKMVDADPGQYLAQIQDMLKSETFENGQYETFYRTENGKTREIFKLPYFPDRIIHHAIMNILEPIWMKIFIRDTYSTMKGRGIHDGVKRMKLFLSDRPETKYCLKLDVKKFYPSIDHDVLKNIIGHSIKCPLTLCLLDKIIDSSSGVPIGNYLSQYFANLYLAYFDHWVKENLKVKYYARYCDDMVILGHDKSALHTIFQKISDYLAAELNLRVKENWQVFRYCQQFCVKLFSAIFLINGRLPATFPMGFDLQFSSIFKQTKVSRV